MNHLFSHEFVFLCFFKSVYISSQTHFEDQNCNEKCTSVYQMPQFSVLRGVCASFRCVLVRWCLNPWPNVRSMIQGVCASELSVLGRAAAPPLSGWESWVGWPPRACPFANADGKHRVGVLWPLEITGIWRLAQWRAAREYFLSKYHWLDVFSSNLSCH